MSIINKLPKLGVIKGFYVNGIKVPATVTIRRKVKGKKKALKFKI